MQNAEIRVMRAASEMPRMSHWTGDRIFYESDMHRQRRDKERRIKRRLRKLTAMLEDSLLIGLVSTDLTKKYNTTPALPGSERLLQREDLLLSWTERDISAQLLKS